MELIHPSVTIEYIQPNLLKSIERIGRVCYKSEGKITPSSAKKFVSTLIKSGHESVIEHASMSLRFIIDRGVSHELVRHRLCSISQESTRYVNYNKKGVVYIIPRFLVGELSVGNYTSCNCQLFTPKEMFLSNLLYSEFYYKEMISQGIKPQEARQLLPNALKTEMIVTANMREWRHIFKLRTSAAAHPDMQFIMKEALKLVKEKVKVIFDDLEIK